MVVCADIRTGWRHVTFGEAIEGTKKELSTTLTITHVSPTCFCCLRTYTKRSMPAQNFVVFSRPVHFIFTGGSAPIQPFPTGQG